MLNLTVTTWPVVSGNQRLLFLIRLRDAAFPLVPGRPRRSRLVIHSRVSDPKENEPRFAIARPARLALLLMRCGRAAWALLRFSSQDLHRLFFLLLVLGICRLALFGWPSRLAFLFRPSACWLGTFISVLCGVLFARYNGRGRSGTSRHGYGRSNRGSSSSSSSLFLFLLSPFIALPSAGLLGIGGRCQVIFCRIALGCSSCLFVGQCLCFCCCLCGFLSAQMFK